MLLAWLVAFCAGALPFFWPACLDFRFLRGSKAAAGVVLHADALPRGSYAAGGAGCCCKDGPDDELGPAASPGLWGSLLDVPRPTGAACLSTGSLGNVVARLKSSSASSSTCSDAMLVGKWCDTGNAVCVVSFGHYVSRGLQEAKPFSAESQVATVYDGFGRKSTT